MQRWSEPTQAASVFPFEDLPEEIQVSVFSFLTTGELCLAALVNRNWRRLASDDSIWVERCRARWSNKQNMMLDRMLEKEIQSHGHPWKVQFALKEKDSLRDELTTDELCETCWKFEFQHTLWGALFVRAMYPVFTKDFKFYMDDRKMRWRWADSHHVQVEQYPPLHITRLDNWGWQMQNLYVTFTSLEKRQHPQQNDLRNAVQQARAHKVVNQKPS